MSLRLHIDFHNNLFIFVRHSAVQVYDQQRAVDVDLTVRPLKRVRITEVSSFQRLLQCDSGHLVQPEAKGADEGGDGSLRSKKEERSRGRCSQGVGD